jgi:acyl-CoA synthetase (AMP-forming)/AMP-acid ligase II
VGQAADLALRYVIFGGEALELESLRPWYERHGDHKPQLVNMYGITETTVHVTYRPLTLEDVNAAAGSVIGVPIPDLQVYILDPNLEPTPIGVPGEIHVGGAGVARGYLNRPELTQQKFISIDDLRLTIDDSTNRQSKIENRKLYRSGDLARYLPDGDIEYLGRIDHQIKIRGFRIELGEIESVLVQHPAVREAAVLARENEPKAGSSPTNASWPTPCRRAAPCPRRRAARLHEAAASGVHGTLRFCGDGGAAADNARQRLTGARYLYRTRSGQSWKCSTWRRATWPRRRWRPSGRSC